MKRVAILISGGGSNMVRLAEDMSDDHPARPVLVLSNNPDAGGLAKAAQMGIATEVVDHRDFKGDREGFERKLISVIDPYAPDILALAGFMRILTEEFVTHYAGRVLNIHPSLLPKYKGLHTHARAIEAGDKEAGCSVHEVTAELDGGPILGQARVPIVAGDTSDDLAARVLVQEHKLYPAVLRRFAVGDKTPVLLP
ncbi:Phosphoribosylglycinamide formyltransferase [Pelagimonas phthalicica]|uniref:Phosphoribosylglycinamide formyltransferase n=1 Tax=Pelagimonas phthalicica TaxID=1037362 RepID=A0A238JET6_9RHOB|nr:phosphoribosylglycinamide formyltransferase [Pelagimonas phthalicica]TDS91298.1 phosphoribosylglycinamide formyltransferase-1 [Pelagimonas phthalicica]SMX28346.1 Phosphoribosylglycinamide formyltransferase [Pelagimonas phthalicica]